MPRKADVSILLLMTHHLQNAMAYSEANRTGEDRTRLMIFVIVGIISALLVAGLIYFFLAQPPSTGSGPPRLAGALRPGSPEFEPIRERVVVDGIEAFESTRPLGDIVMELRATVRNFTGRTINGLEIRGAVIDSEGNSVKERTVIFIPTGRQAELEANRTMQARIMLDQIRKDAVRADIKMEVAGVRFK